MAKYYQRDNRGNEYCTTTETTTMNVESGAMYMETIKEGGDHTRTDSNRFTHRTLGIGPMGATRG
jgi:hypothetical protein